MMRKLFKMTKDTKLFKKGQKVFEIFGTGALASYVVGRYKGKGRFIRAWIHYEDEKGNGFTCVPDSKYICMVK